MGLDVYLYKFEDYETSKKVQEEYETKSEAIWHIDGKSYDQLTNDEKETARIQIRQLDTDMDIEKHNGEKIEFNSSKYPLHYFKVGYFRSSYNDNGINHILNDAIRIDLYSILNPKDEYEFKPDWNAAKEKTKEAIAKFSKYLIDIGGYKVSKVYGFHNQVSNSHEALQVFLKELESNKKFESMSSSYSNSNGEFMFDGFNINGIINGTDCVYIVHKDDELKWYLEALDIVLETIEWVLSQPDPEKYVLHWSS